VCMRGHLDDMGLGKTLQTIALIVSDHVDFREARQLAEDEALAEGRQKPARHTLIVCPLSVVGNWVKQFDVRAHPHRSMGAPICVLCVHVYAHALHSRSPWKSLSLSLSL
jgi:SNF2 family DNA or RNA helicase